MNLVFWKEDLLKQAKALRARVMQKRWTENSFARLEQTVMLGFYSIRKLIEAKKLSDLVAGKSITVNIHKWKGNPVTKMNWSHIDKLYDIDSAQSVNKGLLFLCHQFVHSYVFVTSFNEDNHLDGIFINSDRERHRALYFIEMSQIIDFFEQVGRNYPSSVSFIFDENLGDYRVLSSSRDEEGDAYNVSNYRLF